MDPQAEQPLDSNELLASDDNIPETPDLDVNANDEPMSAPDSANDDDFIPPPVKQETPGVDEAPTDDTPTANATNIEGVPTEPSDTESELCHSTQTRHPVSHLSLTMSGQYYSKMTAAQGL